jgi:hypothetical protein
MKKPTPIGWFYAGQTVKYNGKSTHIEALHGDGTCNIANPHWDWDDEVECVANNIPYDIPFWITVSLSDLSV